MAVVEFVFRVTGGSEIFVLTFFGDGGPEFKYSITATPVTTKSKSIPVAVRATARPVFVL